jgi:polar amino acid transport system substrate-binding protein
MAAMTDTRERQAQVDFVDYFSAGTSILVQRGNPHGIRDLDDLCGHVVAAEEGTIQVELLERTQSSCAHHPIDVHLFPDNDSALIELRTGRAAAVLNDYPPAVRLTTDEQTRSDFELASEQQYEPGYYGIAVPKDQQGLRGALQEALARLIRSGKYDRILEKWSVSSGAVDQARVNGGS